MNLFMKQINFKGEVAEWLKAHAWKACIGEALSRVRIPLSPPEEYLDYKKSDLFF
tara:strand:- start:584 stop:748 length:165 start_codon:yes stop_codon:yes gene_type:complete